MNIKKEEKSLELLATSITDEIKNSVVKILEVSKLNLDDLVEKMNNLNDEEKDNVISKIINNQLIQLKKELTIEQFRKIKSDVENITEYYINSSDKYDIVEEGDTIADDILFKVLGYNNRKMQLPIDISIIKNYCFSPDIKEEKFYDTLIWIAMRYIAISTSIFYYNCQENYNKENSGN